MAFLACLSFCCLLQVEFLFNRNCFNKFLKQVCQQRCAALEAAPGTPRLNFKPRAPKCVTKRSSLCNCLVNTLRIVIRCSLAMNSEWITMIYSMFIDYVHWRLCTLMDIFWPSCWDRFPRTTGGIFRVSQDLRWETPKFSKDSNASKGARCLEVQLLRDLLLQQISWQHGHRVVAIFLKTKSHKARQARLTFNCDGSIQGTSQQPKLFGFIFLAMSSVQLWRSSGAWDLFKATQKN